MKRTNFNRSWKFQKTGTDQWQAVDLPHDAMIHEIRDPESPGGAAVGFFPGGIYVYEKNFAVPEDWQNDIVYIGDDIILKSDDELNALAENDGFDDWEQMKLWFDNPDRRYSGKIIFWKNFEPITLD